MADWNLERVARSCAALFGCLSLGFGIALSGCAAPTGPPDVVLIVVDTLRADHLRSYGFPYETSPNVDRLAEDSALFERAIAASSRTAPSHASMMTSRWVREHSIGHINGSTKLTDEVTLASLLREQGYETAAFVSNYVLRRGTGIENGFDLYDDSLPDVEANRPTVFERTAEATTELALAWLAERGEAPFFLWVHYQDPHGPYTPPPPHDAAFPQIEASDRRPLRELDGQRGLGGIPHYQKLQGIDTVGAYKRRYAGEIVHFDASLGRLLDALERRDRSPVVVFTSDHGESLGEANRYFVHGERTTPEQVHIPMLVKAPGVSPQRRRELVHHVDLLPTVLELVGLPVPEDAMGIALGPYVRDRRPLPDRTVFSDTGREASAYRGDRILRMLETKDNGVSRTAVTKYRWRSDGSLEPTDPQPALRRQLTRYLSEQKPLRLQETPVSEADRIRLRALGYLEPEDE